MAGYLPLTIDQNAKFDRTYTYKIDSVLVDLTGYTGKAQIRDTNGALLVSFTITLGGSLGTIRLQLALAQCLALKSGVWDLLLTPSGGEPSRLLEGPIAISEGVTR